MNMELHVTTSHKSAKRWAELESENAALQLQVKAYREALEAIKKRAGHGLNGLNKRVYDSKLQAQNGPRKRERQR